MGKLVAATGDVAKAQDLASLAMDVSAGSGKSLDAVTMALVRARTVASVACRGSGSPRRTLPGKPVFG